MSTPYAPRLGAVIEGDGVRFRVWAPNAQNVRVRLESAGAPLDVPLTTEGGGYFAALVPGAGAGTRYRYALDGGTSYPDPASRWQPEGVHGASAVVDHTTFRWHDEAWRGATPGHMVRMELHTGTFTPAGTYAAATARLEALAALGVTAIQLMPLSDFPGERGWGYDGVAPMAPARCYGTPDELRALVDRAHALGIAVILDVVYNHFGPDGAYQGAFSPHYFTGRHRTPWGAAINLDGTGSAEVRAYFIEIALHWLHEYHLDGFRLDATNQLNDHGPVHFLREWCEAVRAGAREGARPYLIAEDSRNLDTVVRDSGAGGYGFDEVLADDFHHELRRIVAGDDEGYYRDYRGSAADLATALTRGWSYTGQPSAYWGRVRGTDPAGIPLPRFGHCIQNHDQVGNRAVGERLHHDTSLEAYRAASALLLTSAATPLMFMGQEWAASTPFLFFSDHDEALGRLVTEGRRREFRAWREFGSERATAIPDPQAVETFLASRLDWAERHREPHASVLRLYRALIAVRLEETALQWSAEATQHAFAPDDASVFLVRRNRDHAFATVCCLRGATTVEVDLIEHAGIPGRWEVVLTSEDAPFATHAHPVEVGRLDGTTPIRLAFARPGAVLLRSVAG